MSPYWTKLYRKVGLFNRLEWTIPDVGHVVGNVLSGAADVIVVTSADLARLQDSVIPPESINRQ